ncbi:hypothetical protein [Reyranella sp.]|uniref:hypothetical protein n=1 Tax=Reyranella sp. TaxID=1929291 RepID=UPI00403662C2
MQEGSHRTFLAEIAPWRDAYEIMLVTYVAIRDTAGWTVALSRADLLVSWAQAPADQRFENKQILAERFRIELSTPEGWRQAEDVLEAIAGGTLKTPSGPLPLYNRSMNSLVGTTWIPTNDQWRRDVVYRVHRNELDSPLLNNELLDWELKGGLTPYDGVADLVDDFGLSAQHLAHVRLEVVAWHAAEVDAETVVGDSDAQLACLVAGGVNPANVALGYRVRLNGKTIARGSLHGEALSWEQRAGRQRAVGRIEIPMGAVIQCLATINGHAHHQFWVANPRTLQNAKHAAFREYDQDLHTLRDYLFGSGKRGQEARDLEFGVSWLLWMFGFLPATFGPNKRLENAPDVLATSPSGHFIVVECTTGGLKSDHKLSKLHERSVALRRRLNEGGHSHLRVLPLIVTSLRRDEVQADIEQAEKLGILVGTREDLELAIERSGHFANPEMLYAEAEKATQEKRQQQESETKK